MSRSYKESAEPAFRQDLLPRCARPADLAGSLELVDLRQERALRGRVLHGGERFAVPVVEDLVHRGHALLGDRLVQGVAAVRVELLALLGQQHGADGVRGLGDLHRTLRWDGFSGHHVTVPRDQGAEGAPFRHGLGVRIGDPGTVGPLEDAYGHSGFTGTSLVVDPARRLTVVLLTNAVHPVRGREGVRELRNAVAEEAARLSGLLT